MQLSTATSKTGLPADAQERAFKARQARMAEEEDQARTALAELSEYYRSERVRLLGADNDRLLREFAESHYRGDTNGPVARRTDEEQRAAREGTAAFAAEHRIDLSRLGPLHTEVDRRFDRIVTAGQSSEVEVVDGERDPELDKTYWSFASWDPGGAWWTSNHKFWVERFDSLFLPAWNRSGSLMRMHMWDTGNHDEFIVWRNNGYCVEYKMPKTGPVRISFGVTCAFDEHELDGDDEWGPSSISASVQERGVFEVYSGWWDYTPDTQSYSWSLAPETRINKATYVRRNPVAGGVFRSCTVTTSTVFPAGASIVIYAGTEQRLNATANDTSIIAGVNSSWYFHWITVDAV